uniref:Kelch like family member 30 n=1 Tax=Loxodonta africana TaxID=9785 RepID=G3TR14_LOXAF
MVCNVDDLDFHLPSHAQDMLDGLQRLRSQPKLADVTLLVGGQELPCHRGLLALSSPYFHAMFAGDFAESFSARVELLDLEPAVVAQLVDFVYTGRLTITQGNVEALTRTAARLHFPAVQKVCGRYLQQQLDAANCLGICEFGEQQGLLGVAAKAWAFLRENFEAVAREDEFLQLPQERLAACLASDLLQVQPEQSRLEALLRWVRHDPQARAPHLPELLGLVHLDALPQPCLQQLLASEPLLQASEACQAAVSRGHSVALVLPQKLEEVLVVVGGRALEEDEEAGEDPDPRPGNFAFYNTKAKQWMALPDFPDYRKWGFSMAALNNDIYVTGGSRGTKTDTWSTTQAWCFPLKEVAWRPVAPMLKARTNHASAALNGEIYAIGDRGNAYDRESSQSQRFPPRDRDWTGLWDRQRYCNNRTGAGCPGKRHLATSSACNWPHGWLWTWASLALADVWSVIASPFLPKYLSSPRCAALQGTLYLIGDNTKKVYVYDPGANLWQKVQSLHSLHENGALVPLGDALYVTGGRWQGMDGDYHVEMEAYDRTRDVWTRHGALPRLWLYHSASAVFLDVAQWTQPFGGALEH